jgi:hypothetical protein
MPIIIDALDNPDAIKQTVDALRAMTPPHCAYCKAGLDRHAWTGGTFIHVLTRDDQGRIAKSGPCTRS